jgi:hypothetical protein
MTVAQSAFRAGLLDPAHPAPPGLTDAAGRPAGKRYDVYRNNVSASLIEALEQGFPVILKLVGREFFRAVAAVHVRAAPPTSPLMMLYGAEFADFLAGFPPAQSLPYLPDVARLEYAIRLAYHAADAAPLPGTALAAIAPEALPDTRLHFAPAVRVVTSAHPILGLWRANTVPGAPAPTPGAEAVLVARPDMDPTVTLIPAPALPVLTALMAGTPLGPAFDLGGPDTDPAALLGLLLSNGAIIALS